MWLVLLAMLASGCGGAMPSYTISVRGLGAESPTSAAEGKVVVAISPVTRDDWRQHPAASVHLEWLGSNMGSFANTGSTKGMTSADLSTAIQSADVAVVPLPSFEIRIVNQSAQPVRIAPGGAWLSDDRGHRFRWITSSNELAARMTSQILARQGDLTDADRSRIRTTVESAVHRLALAAPDRVLPPGGDWQGWLIFDLDTRSAELLRDFMLHARHLTLGVGFGGAPIVFRFSVERPTRAATCETGDAACLGNSTTLPLADGPCIQSTIRPRTIAGTQWWMGEIAVANSDLHRTLLADPLTHAVMRRSLILRGVGYALIGLGLGAAAASAALLAKAYGADYGPAGLAFLGLSAVGGGIGYAGSRGTEDAIRMYNLQSDQTGLCAPVW